MRSGGAPRRIVVDRTVVRFHAPETGGTAQPRFITERTLAFEARLEAMAGTPEGIGDGYQEHDVRAAVERHVAEELLAGLADRLIADSAARAQAERRAGGQSSKGPSARRSSSG